MKLWELLDRPEEGLLSREQFRVVLADAAAVFQAVRYLKRRGRKSKGRSDPIDTGFEAAPTSTGDLLEELR
jgi:hypothetical protein